MLGRRSLHVVAVFVLCTTSTAFAEDASPSVRERLVQRGFETVSAAVSRHVDTTCETARLGAGVAVMMASHVVLQDKRLHGSELAGQLILLGFILGGPPSIEPEFEAETGRSLIDGKVTTAVYCWTDPGTAREHPGFESRLETEIAYRLHEHGGRLAAPTIVRDRAARDLDADSLTLGRTLGVDYIVEVDLVEHSLYERGTRQLYRGRSEAFVRVFDVNAEEQIFFGDVLSTYPVRVPRATNEVSLPDFRQEYERHLAERVGRLFHPHELANE